jgi:hypothetical protein
LWGLLILGCSRCLGVGGGRSEGTTWTLGLDCRQYSGISEVYLMTLSLCVHLRLLNLCNSPTHVNVPLLRVAAAGIFLGRHRYCHLGRLLEVPPVVLRGASLCDRFGGGC